jgi:hypothetical protein
LLKIANIAISKGAAIKPDTPVIVLRLLVYFATKKAVTFATAFLDFRCL